jgi:hypothetical protein
MLIVCILPSFFWNFYNNILCFFSEYGGKADLEGRRGGGGGAESGPLLCILDCDKRI